MKAVTQAPMHSADTARPLRWWSDAQLGEVALALEKALRAWEQDWGLQQPHAAQDAVRCVMASSGPEAPSSWKPVALDDALEPACELWWDIYAGGPRADPVLLLVDALFNTSVEPSALSAQGSVSEMAAEAARAAWSDLWARVGQSLAVRVAITAPVTQADSLATLQPAAALFRPWSGAIAITLHWCAQEMRVLLGGAEAAALLAHEASAGRPEAKPLAPVWHAVAGHACTVRAELAPVELTLGAIKSLRVGDVVELSHPLDRPLVAKTADGAVLCEAFLGKLGDPELGGLPLKEFKRRLELALLAEIAAMKDVPDFIRNAQLIYGYEHFINDAGGSLCELDHSDVIEVLSRHTLILYIKASKRDEEQLIRRAVSDPKPLYYREAFLDEQLAQYMQEKGVEYVAEIVPDDFVRWVFPRLFYARIPRYERIAADYGYTVTTDELATVRDAAGFERLVEQAVERGA